MDLRIQYKSNSERTSRVHLFHRQRLTLGGGPSYRRRSVFHRRTAVRHRTAVHLGTAVHHRTGSLPHSLAI